MHLLQASAPQGTQQPAAGAEPPATVNFGCVTTGKGARPKVAIVCAVYDTGGGYIETTIAEALTKYASVEVVTSQVSVLPVPADGVDDANTPSSQDIRVRRLPVALSVRLRIIARGVSKTLRGISPDIVVILSPSQYFSLPAVRYAQQHQAPLVYFSGEHDGQGPPSGWKAVVAKYYKAVVRRRIYRYAATPATLAFAITPQTEQALAKATGRDDIRLISLPVDETVFFHDETARQEVRNARGWGGTVCVFAGQFATRKRLGQLVEVWAEVFPNEADRLVLCGGAPGPERDALTRHIADHGLEHRVEIRPFLSGPDLNAIYNGSDIALFPAPTIGIQQALATGLHVITNPSRAVAHLQDLGMDGFHAIALEDRKALGEMVRSLDASTFETSERRERSAQAHVLSADAIAAQIVGILT